MNQFFIFDQFVKFDLFLKFDLFVKFAQFVHFHKKARSLNTAGLLLTRKRSLALRERF